MDDMPDSFRESFLKSTLIRKGPPVHYQLMAKKKNLDGETDKKSMFRRWTIGEKDSNKPNKTILLIGETGSGKSSLINAMVNYVMGVKMEEKVWFEIVEETNKKMQTESQKSVVTVYEIFGYEGVTIPYSLTIIDTPGYGDTRGIEQDAIITDMLHDLFRSEKGIQEIDAVGLVLKASENRLSDRLTYIFDSVVSLFGKDMEKNIVALITHSDGMPPENALEALEAAKVKCAKDEKNQPVHFLFNNCQNEVITEETQLPIENAWRVTKKGMSEFSKFLGRTSPQKLETTVDVLNERIRLTACIHSLQDRIESIELKQTEIKQTQEALKKYENKMADNENFTIEVDEHYKVKETIVSLLYWWDTKAVTCTVCEENCHYPGCTLAWSPSWCKVMRNDSCSSCTRKCPSSHHVKEGWRWVNKTRKVDKTLQDVKDKYENNKEEDGKNKSLLSSLQEQKEELVANKATYLEEAYQHVVILEEREERYRSHQRLQNTLPGDTVANMHRIPHHFRDRILENALIRKGPPDHYRLTIKKENLDGKTDKESMLRRWTVGEKDSNKPNKTILLVGETGSGKSSLINVMVNYVMGVKMEDKVWFEIVDETNKKMQTESQTSAVTVYEIFGYEGVTVPYSLTIIDTPGYGDTTGIKQDAIVPGMLRDLFRSENGIREIDAVGLVLKASENRLSDRLTYIFDSVVSLFGKDMEKNIVALITHSNGMPPENALEALEVAKIKCAKDEENLPVYFLFNNCQNTVITKKTLIPMENAGRVTKVGMSEFSDFLERTLPQKLQTTVHVLDERSRLTACIQNLKERIEFIELKQTEITQTQEALKTGEKEMADNKNYTIKVDEAYKVKENIDAWWDNKAVTCTVCEENFHYPGCTLAWSPYKCEVMVNENCTSCTKKCPSSDHVKEGWKWVAKTRKVDKTLQDVKDKYEKNKEGVGKNKDHLSSLQEQKEELIANKATFLEEAYQHVVTLEEISLNADSLSTQIYLDFLIEKMKETGNTEKVQKLERMKSRVDQRAKGGLAYRFGQFMDLFHKN